MFSKLLDNWDAHKTMPEHTSSLSKTWRASPISLSNRHTSFVFWNYHVVWAFCRWSVGDPSIGEQLIYENHPPTLVSRGKSPFQILPLLDIISVSLTLIPFLSFDQAQFILLNTIGRTVQYHRLRLCLHSSPDTTPHRHFEHPHHPHNRRDDRFWDTVRKQTDDSN